MIKVKFVLTGRPPHPKALMIRLDWIFSVFYHTENTEVITEDTEVFSICCWLFYSFRSGGFFLERLVCFKSDTGHLLYRPASLFLILLFPVFWKIYSIFLGKCYNIKFFKKLLTFWVTSTSIQKRMQRALFFKN